MSNGSTTLKQVWMKDGLYRYPRDFVDEATQNNSDDDDESDGYISPTDEVFSPPNQPDEPLRYDDWEEAKTTVYVGPAPSQYGRVPRPQQGAWDPRRYEVPEQLKAATILSRARMHNQKRGWGEEKWEKRAGALKRYVHMKLERHWTAHPGQNPYEKAERADPEQSAVLSKRAPPSGPRSKKRSQKELMRVGRCLGYWSVTVR
jgi:hypothetical protein